MANELPPLAAVRKMPSPQPRPAGFRREWLARAAFEGLLIAASLVGALALNEWKESRDRQARARDALAAMRLELQANRDEVQRVIRSTGEVIAKIRQATKEKRRYEDGVLRRAQLVSTAWDSSRTAAITNELPFPTLMALGRAYTLQADYQRDMASFYSTLLGGTLGDVRDNPELLAGLLNEMDGNAQRLLREYDRALKALASG
jgi:type II secretory pathway pseudopilin PulG